MVNVEEKNVQQSSLSAHIESAGFVGVRTACVAVRWPMYA